MEGDKTEMLQGQAQESDVLREMFAMQQAMREELSGQRPFTAVRARRAHGRAGRIQHA